MQIQTTPQIVSPAYDSFTNSLISIREENFSKHERVDISYQDQGNSVHLSLTSRIEYHKATYSAEGIMMETAPSLIQPNNKSGVSPARHMQYMHNQHLEMIKRRVEYLLNELSQNMKRFGSAPSSQYLQNQKRAAYDFMYYNERAVTVSGEISIDAKFTEPDFFSPGKTAERIVNFALLFYNGSDRGEFVAMVKKAVVKGYNQARAALGGFLPPEVDETMALVMKALDDFASGNPVNYSA